MTTTSSSKVDEFPAKRGSVVLSVKTTQSVRAARGSNDSENPVKEETEETEESWPLSSTQSAPAVLSVNNSQADNSDDNVAVMLTKILDGQQQLTKAHSRLAADNIRIEKKLDALSRALVRDASECTINEAAKTSEEYAVGLDDLPTHSATFASERTVDEAASTGEIPYGS